MSDYRGVSVQDRRVAPTQPGRSHRASAPPPPDDLPPRGRRAKQPEGPGKMRVLAWVSIVLTVVMVGTSLTAYWLYRDAFGSVSTKDFKKDLINKAPVNQTGALNVLIVGSDTREGDNAKYGRALSRQTDAGGKRTDTILLMHISPARDKVQVLSLPRDSMVQIPQCKAENGSIQAGRTDMINSAYNTGGITCTIETIQVLTGIAVDHFVEVDFTGFKSIIDAMGGVSFCFKQPVQDKNSKLNITAGNHLLTGNQALAVMRLRHYGDGSDLQRITRQQQLLSNMVKKVTQEGLLSDPGKLLELIKVAGKSVTMNPELANDPQTLLDIAASAKSLSASGVKFIKVPVVAYPADPNRVQWQQPEANELFKQIAQDIEVEPSPSSTAPKVTVKPQEVRVQVLNGSDRQGEAQRVADELTKWGFKVVGIGNTKESAEKTKVLYSAKSEDDAPYAQLAAAKLSGTKPAEATKVKPATLNPYTPSAGVTAPEATGQVKEGPIVQVIIGADYQGVRVPTTTSKAVQANTVTADQKNVCA